MNTLPSSYSSMVRQQHRWSWNTLDVTATKSVFLWLVYGTCNLMDDEINLLRGISQQLYTSHLMWYRSTLITITGTRWQVRITIFIPRTKSEDIVFALSSVRPYVRTSVRPSGVISTKPFVGFSNKYIHTNAHFVRI